MAARAHFGLGRTLTELGLPEAAIRSFEVAVALRGDDFSAHMRLGYLQRLQGRLDNALNAYGSALALRPDDPDALTSLGICLHEIGRPRAALACYEEACRVNPDHALAWFNLALVLRDVHGRTAAIAAYRKALDADPRLPEAWCNLGAELHEAGLHAQALAAYERSIALKPRDVTTLMNRAAALGELKRHGEAIAAYDTVLSIDPAQPQAPGARLHERLRLCDWHTFEADRDALRRAVARGGDALHPFHALACFDAPDLQRMAATNWLERRFPARPGYRPAPRPRDTTRIRIGYFCADLHHHATSLLMAGVFELHDRRRFEVIGFSLRPRIEDAMRARLDAAFDAIIDVDALSDAQAVAQARAQHLDIAIHLGVFTDGARLGIFAQRVAPLQVNYLGYLGTSGAGYFDAIIADRVLIPPGAERYYSEAVLILPSYQPTDPRRAAPGPRAARSAFGLPDDAFVFCCLNENHKILPATFELWMRILKRVEGSVLLLYEGTAEAARNLRSEAVRRGVNAERLVFGPRLPVREHLARLGAADLFLDTSPYNAGTIASDSLWAGTPLITSPGLTFASRVAASVLTSAGMTECIAANPAAYEALAVALATDPARLARLRATLAANRTTAPLFDTARHVAHLEAALERAYTQACAPRLATQYVTATVSR